MDVPFDPAQWKNVPVVRLVSAAGGPTMEYRKFSLWKKRDLGPVGPGQYRYDSDWHADLRSGAVKLVPVDRPYQEEVREGCFDVRTLRAFPSQEAAGAYAEQISNAMNPAASYPHKGLFLAGTLTSATPDGRGQLINQLGGDRQFRRGVEEVLPGVRVFLGSVNFEPKKEVRLEDVL